MLLHFCVTYFLINLVQLRSIYAIESDIKSDLLDIISEQPVMRGDQQLIRADQRIIRSDLARLLSDQHQLKADQVFIKQELVQGKSDLQMLRDDQKYVKKHLQEVKELLGQAKKGQKNLEKMLGPQGFIQQELKRGKVDLKAIKDNQEYVKKDLQEVNEMLGQSKKGQERLENMLNTLLVKIEPLTTQFKSFGRSCADAPPVPKRSGVYDIVIPRYSAQPFKVYCDAEILGGNWLTIMRREDGSVEFNRNWTDYKYGFGDIDREFFLGMDKIHVLTQDQQQELLVILEDYDGKVAYETYDAFAIGSESEQYRLHTLGSGSGDAGDSLSYNRGMSFTTADRDNDYSDLNCAVFFSNPWWHKNCFESNLFGTYGDHTYGKGILWKTFRGYSYSLRRVRMMIRPKWILSSNQD